MEACCHPANPRSLLRSQSLAAVEWCMRSYQSASVSDGVAHFKFTVQWVEDHKEVGMRRVTSQNRKQPRGSWSKVRSEGGRDLREEVPVM